MKMFHSDILSEDQLKAFILSPDPSCIMECSNIISNLDIPKGRIDIPLTTEALISQFDDNPSCFWSTAFSFNIEEMWLW